MRATTALAKITLLLILIAVPAAALFGPPKVRVEGVVNSIHPLNAQNPTNFTILTHENQLFHVMVEQGKVVPSEVQLGVRVRVKAVQGDDGLWYLDKFEKIELLPNQPGRR